MEKELDLSIHITEDDRDTVATAILELKGERFEVNGRARRNPADPPSPLVGEELAIARALAKLEARLMEAARDKIEHFVSAG